MLAKIEWDQFAIKELVGELYVNRMLLLLSIPTGKDVTTFCRPKLQDIIRSYARGYCFEAHILSKLPRYCGKTFIPASHHIFRSRHVPHWHNYTTGPFNLKFISQSVAYTEYFINFKGPIDDWELLGEILTAKVWVLIGVSIRAKGSCQIPGRKPEGFGRTTCPTDIAHEMDKNDAAVANAMES